MYGTFRTISLPPFSSFWQTMWSIFSEETISRHSIWILHIRIVRCFQVHLLQKAKFFFWRPLLLFNCSKWIQSKITQSKHRPFPSWNHNSIPLLLRRLETLICKYTLTIRFSNFSLWQAFFPFPITTFQSFEIISIFILTFRKSHHLHIPSSSHYSILQFLYDLSPCLILISENMLSPKLYCSFSPLTIFTLLTSMFNKLFI